MSIVVYTTLMTETNTKAVNSKLKFISKVGHNKFNTFHMKTIKV